MPLRTLALDSKPLTFAADAPIKTLLPLMFEQRINHIALVDAQGHLVGLASIGVALEQVIPAAARARRGLDDLAFAGDARRLLLDHFRDLLEQPASVLIDSTTAPLPAATPLMEAALLLTRAHAPLPVVDEQGKLLGILSQRRLLQYLASQTGAP